jgi:hypothetical protein
MKNITWKDLIGTWRSKPKLYDLSIRQNGNYELYNCEIKNRHIGKINSSYKTESNTVTLIMENHVEVELFQLLHSNIILVLENKKIEFERILD